MRSIARPVMPPALGVLALAVTTTAAPSGAGAQDAPFDLPPVPEDRGLTQDRASVLDEDAVETLDSIQDHALGEHDTPIVVVTIESRTEYGGEEAPIEALAQAWFDHWEIGIQRLGRGLINQGVLVLLSVEDREARIELGAGWGRGWDGHANRIMDEAMVPRFEEGRYGTGMVDGAWELLEMAEQGPAASAPGGSRLRVPLLDGVSFTPTPVPPEGRAFLVACGVLLLLLAWKSPGQRGPLILAGGALVLGSVVLWALLGLVAAAVGKVLPQLRIPLKWSTHSDRSGPPVPAEVVHRVQRKWSTHRSEATTLAMRVTRRWGRRPSSPRTFGAWSLLSG